MPDGSFNIVSNRHSSFRREPLTDDDLRRMAPSVFATRPWSEVSDRYRFIPTIDVVNRLRGEGFFPYYARQGKVRIEGKQDYTKHLLRFRKPSESDLHVGSRIFEIALLNSHDRTTGYQMMAGIMEVVCLNGLIVGSNQFGNVKARHSGRIDIADQVIEASYEIIGEAPKILDKIGQWENVHLREDQRLAYATAAVELRNSDASIDPRNLLKTRRPADDRPTLWKTFNVVQENLIRGGVRAVGATGHRFRTRAVNAPQDDVKLNKALWRLTEELAKVAA